MRIAITMTTQSKQQRIRKIQHITGLGPTHFADLVRVAQIIHDPAGGISGRVMEVNWLTFGLSETAVANLRSLGHKYQHDSPHVDIDLVWDDLTPETRS